MTTTEAPPRPDALAVNIVRLADAVATLNPRRRGSIRTLGEISEVQALATICTIPNGQDWTAGVCCQCGKAIEVRVVVAVAAPGSVACDECREKHETAEALKRSKAYWEKVCPALFRSTDINHTEFPKAVYADLRKLEPNQSLFFYGPTGSCKTRVAVQLLKHHLLAGRTIDILWPEKVRTLSQGFENTTFDHYATGAAVLLLDDVLLTACRDGKMMDALKQLVDVRIRENLPFIITSQIGQEEDLATGKDFGEAKTADLERIKALLRRLREKCKVISFAKAEPKEGETQF